MKENQNLAKLLNLSYLHYSNKTASFGAMDMPALYCNTEVRPDYLALYSNVSDYHRTSNTAVCFYQFDSVFDGKDGLFEAIYHNNKKQLLFYKNRFKGVKFFISPDYSELGDIHIIENTYRIFKARIVALWLMFELDAVVIPNISFSSDFYAQYAHDGLEHCSVVAYSTKGHMQEKAENERLRHNIQITVDTLPCLKTIIVYDVCSTNEAVYDTFSYAIQKGIEIVIPNNSLKERNMLRKAVAV